MRDYNVDPFTTVINQLVTKPIIYKQRKKKE